MWDEQTHARVFAQLPARIGYSLPASDDRSGYRADGPYRTNASVGGAETIRLATRERLTADVLVENAGGTAGTYNASLAINGTAVTMEQGRLEPGEQRTVPLSHTFATPGRYELSVDGDNVTVLVERPARARVESVEVSSQTAVEGETVVVTATVVNDAEIPAAGTVVFTRNFEAVAEREVRMGPKSTTRVSSGVAMLESGQVLLAAGAADPVEVTVSPSSGATPVQTATATPTQTTSSDGAGFTAVAALIALLLAALAARRRGEP
jgi:PGF-CTERM protein